MAVRLLDYAFRGDLKKLKRCVDSGVDVDACESSGKTALYHAVNRNQLNCVYYLLRCGADPNRINKAAGYTPVNEACLKNNVKCLSLLVQYGGSLEHLSADHKESAIVSAYKKHSTRVIHFINLLRDEALTKDGRDLLQLEADKKEKAGNKQNVQFTTLPGLEAVVPEVTTAELKTPYVKLFNDMPHMTLQSALWHTTPVTVKRFKGREDSRQLLMREADLLSWLRHPRVALLMAVCLAPRPEPLCLVMERFELASLNHLLYKTQTEMNLPQRVHLLLDVAEGMIFLHNHCIVHGFVNSFSVFVTEKLRAKIGNLEFAQEDSKQKQESSVGIPKNWMAPEQLLREPPNMTGDVYSFGVLMWETLARTLPWSWLPGGTIKEALCVRQMTLPMLELWPNYIKSIMTECFKDPADRPSFCSVHEYLLAIKNSGEGLTSDVLDGAFLDWYVFQCKTTHVKTQRRKTTVQELLSRASTYGTSEIYVMLRRSSSQGNGRRRGTSVKGGLTDVLKVFSKRPHDSPREEEIERFGYPIAERLAVARNVRRTSRNYTRASWAKEAALTRALEGDIERVLRNTRTAASAKKHNNKESSRRGRRYSIFNPESLEKILITSAKYQKNDWSKVLHGMEKLKNSMKGFKEKVNEELIEYGRHPLTDDDSISEHTVCIIGYDETDMAREMNKDEDISNYQAGSAFLALKDKDIAALKLNGSCSEENTSQNKLQLKENTDSPSPTYAQPVKTRRKSVTQQVERTGCDVTSNEILDGSVVKINRNGEGDILHGDVYAEPHSSRRNSKASQSDTNTLLKDKTNGKSKTRLGGFVILKSPGGTPTKWKEDDQSENSYNAETSMLQGKEGGGSKPHAMQSDRLRTQSLGEKHVLARKSFKQRSQSARERRKKTHERQNKSGITTVASDSQGVNNVDRTLPNDSVERNHCSVQVRNGGAE